LILFLFNSFTSVQWISYFNKLSVPTKFLGKKRRGGKYKGKRRRRRRRRKKKKCVRQREKEREREDGTTGEIGKECVSECEREEE
jgi:hypothetical protein